MAHDSNKLNEEIARLKDVALKRISVEATQRIGVTHPFELENLQLKNG
jgi:hypothetical protein